MPRRKRIFEAEAASKSATRLQPSIRVKSTGGESYAPGVKPAQLPFPREVVLRLIDWIKQI